MPTPKVIDISHHQAIPKDLKKAKAAGIIAVIHKCTEGQSYVDGKCAARRWLALDAGLEWGIYHFLRPGSIEKQVSHFLNTAVGLGVMDDDTLLVADHEDQGVPGQDLKKWLDMVEDATGRSPVIYSGHVLKEQLAGSGYHPVRRLWLCHYSSKPVLPEGVDKFWLWQFTDKGDGSLYGIDGNVDLNALPDGVSDADFLASWSGAHKAPEPKPPTPELEIPVLTLSADRPVKIHLGPNITVM